MGGPLPLLVALEVVHLRTGNPVPLASIQPKVLLLGSGELRSAPVAAAPRGLLQPFRDDPFGYSQLGKERPIGAQASRFQGKRDFETN